MRIGVLGKGGSGKTTISSALAAYFAKQQQVLAIDADQNANMSAVFNMRAPVNLADHEEEIFSYLHEYRTGIKPIGTTPPGEGSVFVKVGSEDPLIKKYTVQRDNLLLMQVGSYDEEDVGTNCYHGKQASLEAIFHHLLDPENDIFITDSTAVLDSLGNSLYMTHHCIFYVVEPTMKSVSVFQKFYEIATKKQLLVRVVANKIQSQKDMDFLHKHIREDVILTSFQQDTLLRDLEQGDTDALEKFVSKYVKQFLIIQNFVRTLKKNWSLYLENLKQLHTKSGLEWYDDYYKRKVSQEIDPHFSYDVVLKS
jgi:CO dehydrogenase maturation factor